jgi:transcriptional regulator with XRE-family HTH domain
MAAPVGEQLRAAREQAGLSLREVVARSGGKVGSAAALSMIETGARYPSLRTLEGLARALRLTITIGQSGVEVRRQKAK